MTVGGGFVGAEVVTIGVGTNVASDDVDVDKDVQAAVKIDMMTSTII